MLQMSDSRSNFGSNIKMICKYNGTTDIFLCKKNLIKYKNINESEIWRVGFLHELINARNQGLLPEFSMSEINCFIDHVACC